MTTNYDGDERRAHVKESWHMSRSVPISLITVLLIQAAAGFYWGGKVETRITNLEDAKVTVVMTKDESERSHELLQVQINQNADTSKEIKESLHNIDGKLDRLIEREK